MGYSFEAKVKLFEREKGWYYVSVPKDLSTPLEYLADRGLIAVTARVGSTSWPTSLLPMGDGTHFIALPAKVRTKEKLLLNAELELSFEIRERSGDHSNERSSVGGSGKSSDISSGSLGKQRMKR